MVDRRALAQAHRGGDVRRRLLARDAEDLRRVQVAALDDLVVDVAHVQQVGDRVQLGHIGAGALATLDQAFGFQLAQRAVHGHARTAELLHQLPLGGQADAGLPAAIGDALLDRGLDRFVGERAFAAGVHAPHSMRGHAKVV